MIFTDFNWSEKASTVSLAFLCAALIVYLWFALKEREHGFSLRFWVRFSLHMLLWVSLLGFVLQPFREVEVKRGTGLVFGKDVPVIVSNHITDSLQKAEVLEVEKPGLSQKDTLILVGQDFPEITFQSLMLSEYLPVAIKWIPFDTPGQIENLSWKGILRNGEMQYISGTWNGSEGQWLKLRYGNSVIDSTLYIPRTRRFNFAFPAFSLARTTMTLESEGNVLDTIRFYSRKTASLKFRFLLSSPDFESRTLAAWLGKNGHSVEYTSILSKDMVSEIAINQIGEPDILVVDTENAGSKLVKKYLATAAGVLIINLVNPITESATVNKELGTGFHVASVPQPITAGKTPWSTLPYRFVPSAGNIPVSNLPVLIEKKAGNIAMSLLNETYPMMLSGDTMAYGKLWNEIIAGLRPPTKANIEIDSPVFQDVKSNIELNNFVDLPRQVSLATDTVFLKPSVINSRSTSGSFSISNAGWLNLADSLNIYIEQKGHPGYKRAYQTEFLRKFKVYQSNLQKANVSSETSRKGAKKYIPDWVWFVLITGALTGIWIEEKI